eukprot:394595-Amphidinium_carterae.1
MAHEAQSTQCLEPKAKAEEVRPCVLWHKSCTMILLCNKSCKNDVCMSPAIHWQLSLGGIDQNDLTYARVIK